jgi:hypothetical protein
MANAQTSACTPTLVQKGSPDAPLTAINAQGTKVIDFGIRKPPIKVFLKKPKFEMAGKCEDVFLSQVFWKDNKVSYQNIALRRVVLTDKWGGWTLRFWPRSKLRLGDYVFVAGGRKFPFEVGNWYY